MKLALSPESQGVVLALLAFGKIRRFDHAGLELAQAGLAEVRDDQLRINDRGRRLGKALEKHPKRLASIWQARRTRKYS
jgi:hypothetical protein